MVAMILDKTALSEQELLLLNLVDAAAEKEVHALGPEYSVVTDGYTANDGAYVVQLHFSYAIPNMCADLAFGVEISGCLRMPTTEVVGHVIYSVERFVSHIPTAQSK